MNRPVLAPYDARSHRRNHRLRNAVQSVLLLGAMVLLLAACGWILAGLSGIIWASIVGGVVLAISARLSPIMVLRMFGARPLQRGEAPEVQHVVEALSRRAGLERPPALFHVSTPQLLAFSVGSRKGAAITVTTGLLRELNLREIAGVLAHELSHVRHNDIWIMALANSVRQVTGMMSFFGMMLLILNLPLLMTGRAQVPWLLVLLLISAPTIVSLLQLALSRTREFDADLDAAGLTGDPMGLASALEALERKQGRFWERMMAPTRPDRLPSLLRTHPTTEERVARLRELRDHEPYYPPDYPGGGNQPPHGLGRLLGGRKRRFPGPWGW